MTGQSRIIDRSPIILRPDPTRTVIRPFSPGDPAPFGTPEHPRALRIAERVLALAPDTLHDQLDRLMQSLSGRHDDVPGILARRYEEISDLFRGRTVSDKQRALISAYLLEEYAFEAAALFNPSMVPHWDQTGLPPRTERFVMALRGVGEGHRSSVTFRTGRWSEAGGFELDPLNRIAVAPHIDMAATRDADALAVLRCDGRNGLSDTVLFPILPSQTKGIEDLRLVRFTDDDGDVRYFGTYTAFNGAEVRQELIETRDFFTFTMRRVLGSVGDAKGLAIFPRRIGGAYFALSRQDGENIWLMTSDNPLEWSNGHRLLTPKYRWEFVQLGNCGSPLEIEEGWLVLTHGVGMVRNYAIGACLLDRNDPSRVLRRTAEPIIAPSPNDRHGYVPNVVYSCGGMICGRVLVLPYGVADNFATFATIDVDALLASMEPA
ncbi:glycoside hydrolase family 130 protein [Sphingomonas sp. PR090111-T3T-6A]|uniref:glycoside hydrolase family 130 protein n=1 Tax=Sphingomonas sp. PR090111-T3T-6A TaxID=685778 RepID=UPI000375B9BD